MNKNELLDYVVKSIKNCDRLKREYSNKHDEHSKEVSKIFEGMSEAYCDIYEKVAGEPYVTSFDIKTIQKGIEKIDMMLRPCALLLSPSRVSELKESIPDIEEKVLLVPSEMVPNDKFYLIDRKELTPEHYLKGDIK